MTHEPHRLSTNVYDRDYQGASEAANTKLAS